MSEKMDDKVELVAQAFYEASSGACLWDDELVDCREQFREFVRNVINLLNEDIGALLLASENASAKERVTGTRLVA